MSRERWEMHDVRGNASTGLYYTLTTRTPGVLDACVTVKHTRHDTCACLTCHSTTCTHARFVEAYRANHPEQLSA